MASTIRFISRNVNTPCIADGATNRIMEDHERLKAAREDATYGTAADAARAFGWNEVTYRAHENGQNGFNLDQARVYAKAFRVNVEWLVSGRGPMKTGESDPDFDDLRENYYSLTSAEQRGLVDLARTLASGSAQGR